MRDHESYRLESPPTLEDIQNMKNVSLKSPTRGRMIGGHVGGRSMLPRSAAVDNASIFVGNLPPTANKKMVKEIFEVYGTIMSMDVVQKPMGMSSVHV